MRTFILSLILAGILAGEVMTTPSGARYHTSAKCLGLKSATKAGKVARITEAAAKASGKTACRSAACKRVTTTAS